MDGDGFPVVGECGGHGMSAGASGPVKPSPTAVYDQPVTRIVTDYEEFPGDIDRLISVQVTARVSGYLNDPVYFKDGTMIEKDAKLFQIDPSGVPGRPPSGRGNVSSSIEAHVERLKKEYRRAKNLLSSAIGQPGRI